MLRSSELRRTACTGALSLLVASTAGAVSGVTMVMNTEEGESILVLTADEFVMTSPEGEFSFDAAAEAISMTAEGQTHTMTKAQLQQMSAMASQAGGMGGAGGVNAMMREQALKALERMPASERAAAQAEIDRMYPPDAPTGPKSYEPMNESTEVAGHKADGYWIVQGGERVGQLWAAELSAVGLEPADLSVFTKMRAFLADVSGGPGMDMLESFAIMDPESDDFMGLILRMEDADGKGEILSVTKGDVER